METQLIYIYLSSFTSVWSVCDDAETMAAAKPWEILQLWYKETLEKSELTLNYAKMPAGLELIWLFFFYSRVKWTLCIINVPSATVGSAHISWFVVYGILVRESVNISDELLE